MSGARVNNRTTTGHGGAHLSGIRDVTEGWLNTGWQELLIIGPAYKRSHTSSRFEELARQVLAKQSACACHED